MVILFGHPNRVPEYPTKLLPEWKKFGTRALVLDRILELPQVMDEAALPPPADVVPCTPGVADHDSSVVSEDLPRHILAARSRHLVDLLRDRDALPHEGLQHPYVLEDVALVEVEEERGKGRGDVGPVVDEEHQEPVTQGELERMARADVVLPVTSRQPLPLEPLVSRFYLRVDGIKLGHLKAGERPERLRPLRQLLVAEHGRKDGARV